VPLDRHILSFPIENRHGQISVVARKSFLIKGIFRRRRQRITSYRDSKTTMHLSMQFEMIQ